ncbi:transcriptional regulator, TetR family [Aeromicrobium choanae]|uniref:Transcriptional regulator, TetR family n=2 Tax=Aeromicrobium choanae TaxID=1736691 RepID=A0A1T4YYR9_9ACTN|nr:transcriptional regulator, TetR family [Aeromicrobium choanae]
MHSMAQSASSTRRERTLAAIVRCARQLTDQCGLDGFTMEELAEASGVSRRTLFNYVPGKLDAVLGPDERPDETIVSTFLSGGPTGDLLVDVKELVRASLEADVPDPAELDVLRRTLRQDTRLMEAVHERFVDRARMLSEAIAHREGKAVDPLEVRLIGNLILTWCDTALDESLADPSQTMAHHFDRVFTATSALFGTRRA